MLGDIVIERKYFILSQLRIEPRSLDLQANTLPCRCKSQLLPEVVEEDYISRPCDRYISFYHCNEKLVVSHYLRG